jgi:ferredoxin
MMNYVYFSSMALCLSLIVTLVTSFAPPLGAMTRTVNVHQLYSTSTTNTLSVTLEKPLGMLLEEMEEGAAMGVKVQELTEGGSAAASEFKDQLVGLKLASVMGKTVTAAMFDDVMDLIIEAPSPVTIDFELEVAEGAEVAEPEPEFAVGTSVTIKVLQEGKPDMSIDAKVGDNLRLTLIQNDVELYRGLKKKLGNCGGGGQCTFCAIEMTDTTGWGERSDWEDQKIGKKMGPEGRLACMNNIQGPATVRTI